MVNYSWYDYPTRCVRHEDLPSDPFVVERRDEHASVLSPALFLVVIDLLLRGMSRVCT